MLPKLVRNTGVVALTAGATLAAVTAATTRANPVHNIYPVTISKNSSGAFVIPDKLDVYSLDFHGSVTWNVENTSGEDVEVKVTKFIFPGPRKCPIEFTHNSGNTATCASVRTIKDRQTKFVRVQRGDTNPDTKERYRFSFMVNGIDADPEIEIDRDPGNRFWWKYLYQLLIAGGGVISMLVGWWMLNRQR